MTWLGWFVIPLIQFVIQKGLKQYHLQKIEKATRQKEILEDAVRIAKEGLVRFEAAMHETVKVTQ